MYKAIAAINKSSKSVTYVIGILKTVPRHAHIIVLFFLNSFATPNAPISIITRVIKLMINGCQCKKYAIPKDSSI